MVSPSPTSDQAPALGRAETPIAFIQAIATAYTQRGLRVDEALKKGGEKHSPNAKSWTDRVKDLFK